jgi:tRNA-2-methylthio-N6-dimethylallyladenosine synthase
MKRYFIWTIGCQMNEADSGRVAAELDGLGYTPTAAPGDADVIVLNTCVVRQSAEERVMGRLWSLKPLKDADPRRVIALMGCMVGVRPNRALQEQLPFVDVFMPPSDPGPLLVFLAGQTTDVQARALEDDSTWARHFLQDMSSPEAAAIGLIHDPDQFASNSGSISSVHLIQELKLSGAREARIQSVRHLSLQGAAPISANVPIVYGCSHACAFCIIPLRRGVERSRPVAEIVDEVQDLVSQGVREVTLLGQIVDRYGKDFPRERPDLADLLSAVHEVRELWRIRFLTSHPSYMNDRILAAVADLPKVCEQIEIPVQAGSNVILDRMRRGYTRENYRDLVTHVRERIPGAAVHTDVIVGFPGETSEQFQETYDLLADLRLDKAHLAMYSPRPGTLSARRMPDDVPQEEKKRRWEALDQLQADVVGEINRRQMGKTVEVLVEDLYKGKWRGRTRTSKLVFFEDQGDWRGHLCDVEITWAGPWSMIGRLLVDRLPASSMPLTATGRAPGSYRVRDPR